MKTILVPTDFSPASELALEFAARLAQNKKARIVLLHVYLGPIPIAEISNEFWQQEMKLLKASSEKKLKEAWARTEPIGKIQHKLLAEEGDPSIVILEKINKIEPELIVMGTRGSQGLATLVFGSTTAAVLNKSRFPVLAVPSASGSRKVIRKFTFATDYNESDALAIADLVELARSYKAQVNILHVSPLRSNSEDETQLMKDFRDRVTSLTEYNQMSFQILAAEDIEDEILRYMQNGNTDVMVFSTMQRSFFERLFHASLTRKIVLQSEIPVLAFHRMKEHKEDLFHLSTE